MTGLWFAIVVLANDQPAVTERMAQRRYPTEAACLADTGRRVVGMSMAGIHGAYLCMTPGESDARLARARKGRF